MLGFGACYRLRGFWCKTLPWFVSLHVASLCDAQKTPNIAGTAQVQALPLIREIQHLWHFLRTGFYLHNPVLASNAGR